MKGKDTSKTINLSMIGKGNLIVRFLMHWQITFHTIICLLSVLHFTNKAVIIYVLEGGGLPAGKGGLSFIYLCVL